MNEENITESGFDDFEAGLFGDDYHTDTEDTAEETVETTSEETEETEHDGAETETETEEKPETEDEDTEHDEVDADTDSGDQGAEDTDSEDSPQMFTIKVNKKEEQHTLEEMTALAQKGSDYDRVKAQLAQAQNELSTLREGKEASSKYDAAIAQLEAISRTNDTPIEDLTMMLRKSILKNKGMSESEIAATIRAEDAEWKLNNPEAHKMSKGEERFLKDSQEFDNAYPDVVLTEEEQKAMSGDISNGMSILNAYQKMKNEEKDAALEEAQKTIKSLERQLKAEKRNRENHYKSPGSMSDSGGKISDDGLDDFTKGLFG